MRVLLCTGISILYCFILSGQQEIKGRILSEGYPLQNAHVFNLASGLPTTSDKDGRYLIMAKPREELRFTYMGMDTIVIMVEDVTRTLNINMRPKVNELDEVIVTERISKQKKLAMDYFTDPTIVNSSIGYLSPTTVAYHFKVVDGAEFIPGSDILNAIASRISGVRVGNYSNASTGLSFRTLFLRGGGSIGYSNPALFEVDGTIFTDPPIWLDVSLVQRVGVIPGLQAVWRYGSIASGGVVIINTKNAIHGLREENTTKIYDQALLRNNFLKDNSVSNIEQERPSYLKKLKASASLEEALQVFENYANLFSGVPYFYIDSYNFMYQNYGLETAEAIIEKNFEKFNNNPLWLRALAFYYESQNRFDKAHELYKKVYILRPDYAQSFIDMAASYRNLENHGSAASLYARYSYLLDAGLMTKDSLDLPELMERELHGLFTGKGTAAVRNFKEAKGETGDYSTRLVFEWSDSEAEFELQFVNPENQYFNWRHTLGEMPERIRSEKQFGYSMVDFLLDDALPGRWSVNATYLGNKQLTPTYLKATIYNNFGNKLQRREVKVFRLGTKGANQNLYSFDQTSRVVFDGQMD